MFFAPYQIVSVGCTTDSFARKLNSDLMECVHRNIKSNV
uniref:Uncharacterized protein n=1 Tax=Wuchereria bancrofti TaxID=6293 RepID=A0AAF5PYN4_WUCBA